jgi:hypothetical protein
MGYELRIELTIGKIARRFNEPLHKVEYAVKSRCIRPAARAGVARIFDTAGLEQIAAALREMNARSTYVSSLAAPCATGGDSQGGNQ